MLARSQVALLLEQGRETVKVLTSYYAEFRDFQVRAQDAFSLGKGEALKALQEKTNAIQAEITTHRDTFAALIIELRRHAEDCLQEYKSDLRVGAQSDDFVSLPDPPEQMRLEAFEEYFLTIEKAVSSITERLV